MNADFVKIKQNNLTLYIRKNFLSSDLGQALLSGEETLRKRYPLKTLPSSEFSRVCKFNIPFEGADRDIYIKWFFRKSGLASLKSLIFGSLAKCSHKAEMMLAQNGFDVPVTVAVGESCSGLFHSESFSVTLGIENTKRAIDIARQTWEIMTPEQLAGFRDLLRNFGRTIGKMHANGIFHGDLRFGNVLLSPERASWRFFFIDNTRTKKFILLPFWLRVKNLVQLNISACGLLSRTDRMRFFTEYCAWTGIGKKTGKILIKAVLRKTRQRLNTGEKIRRALGQTLRTNSKYTLVKTANYRGVFTKSFWPQTGPLDFIKNLDKIIESGQFLKNNDICVVSRLKWNGSDIAVARYKTKGLVDSLRQTFGNSTAKSTWLNAHRTRLLKIPSPNPLAYIELRKSGLVKSSCFVTEYVEGQKLPDSPCDANVPVADK
ncbi:MAG: lipopolysaccharide kinase InaA family protein [Sedimentisphaerales bacterium]